MTNEFIPYEEALALKELGFDESCFATYNMDRKVSRNPSHNMEDLPIEGQPYYWQNSKIHISCITAPLYQQAFRWFREKHNIQGYIYSSTVRGNSEKTKQFTGYIWNINGIDMPFISTDARDELHDTYEEAELACLKKLIEIVKSKKDEIK